PRKRKLKNSVISTEGPIFHYSGRLVLPIYERDIFNIVYSGVQEEKSFEIHDPRFDMTDVKGHINQYGARAGFSIICHVFSLGKLLMNYILTNVLMDLKIVCTFKVVDLLSDDKALGSPYNKATFLPMPFFTTEEL
ncbi:20197_t:CDS:2, partial [Funneliformis geosporum]